MRDTVQLTESDREDLLEIHKALMECLNNLPENLIENEKFGLIVVNAMLNIVCTIAVNVGTEKQELVKGLEQVFDGRKTDRRGDPN